MAKRTKIGLVVSNKMNKTIVVKVLGFKIHPIYKKRYRVSRKFKVHNESSGCQIGDKVLIEEIRPLSASKRWQVVKVLEKRE